jgi:pilus assembly protein Flp/PilA
MNQLVKTIRSFVQEEDGAQVIEYALIVAIVSLGLILLIMPAAGGGIDFSGWITRVNNCLTGAAACN